MSGRNLVAMKRFLIAILIAGLGALGPATVPSAKTSIEGKLRGGMDRLLALGHQPDQRLDYLVQGSAGATSSPG